MSLAPLLVAASLASRSRRPGRRAFFLGLLSGVVYFAGTLYWIAQVMATHGGLPVIVAILLAGGLVAWLAVFVGLFSAIVALAVRRWGPVALWSAPAIWVATEWLRAWGGGRFPWVLLGSSQAEVLPVIQLASVTGVHGLSALIALVGTAAAALAVARDRSTRFGVAGVGVLLVVVIGWGAWRVADGRLTASGTPLRVGLVQGNVPQDAKWDPQYRDAIVQRYLDLSRVTIGDGAEMVIWPEAATPFYFDLDDFRSAPIRQLVAQSQTPFIIGTDEFEPAVAGQPDRYYNAVALVGPQGQTRDTYRKMRLVPFGEFVPFKSLLFFVGPLVEAVSDFSAGTEPTVFEIQGRRLSVAICYEAIYPDLARTFVAGGAELLATITNDAWFGESSAAFQHFGQASMRAVEQGRFLVRAANTGISGAVDPYGRVLVRTPLFETTTRNVDVRLLDGRTIYYHLGDIVLWLSLAGTALLVVALARRPRPASSEIERGS